MVDALRIGIVGLGTVGSSVVRVLKEKRDLLTKQCGRPIDVVAVSARDKTRERGIDLQDIEWVDDPLVLAASNEIDVFVELIGGEEGIARFCVEEEIGRAHV